MAAMPQATSVLIVGGGPCGLTLAIELGRRGVDAVLIDAKPGTAVSPQANATQARTMEHFRRLGFAEEVRALGLPKDYPTDIAYFTRYGGIELARFRLPPAQQAQTLARSLTAPGVRPNCRTESRKSMSSECCGVMQSLSAAYLSGTVGVWKTLRRKQTVSRPGSVTLRAANRTR
jgi:hypothetical protein